MSDFAIQTVSLGKKYRIAQVNQTTQYRLLSEEIVNFLRSPFEMIRSQRETFWALKDISLTIKYGEVVGLIGENGAGKSTLLKLLSRITEPSAGHAVINGRLSSLLEVGTGFHGELTGRENIYLNGAIMGMRRAEMRRKFDEIVDFAGVEQFIETPVKRYSSGMYVRLAFAVAAHLEPDILLVDEVLSVGDAAFRKKSLGKMKDVAREGRTVILVSHNMGSIRQLSNRCIWLDKGQIRADGETPEIINQYLTNVGPNEYTSISHFEEDKSKPVQIRSAMTVNTADEPTEIFSCDDEVSLKLRYQVHEPVSGIYAHLRIMTTDNILILESYSNDLESNIFEHGLECGIYAAYAKVPPRTLGHGLYKISCMIVKDLVGSIIIEDERILCQFALEDTGTFKGNNRAGYLSTLPIWEIHPEQS